MFLHEEDSTFSKFYVVLSVNRRAYKSFCNLEDVVPVYIHLGKAHISPWRPVLFPTVQGWPAGRAQLYINTRLPSPSVYSHTELHTHWALEQGSRVPWGSFPPPRRRDSPSSSLPCQRKALAAAQRLRASPDQPAPVARNGTWHRPPTIHILQPYNACGRCSKYQLQK